MRNKKWKVYGILPMAGKGARIQPIAFSKELYPVVFKNKHYAISEFSIRAIMRAGVDEIKLVVHPEKMDIPGYYAKYNAPISIYFHYRSLSLPESSLFPIDGMHDEDLCLLGLPDTLFHPNDGYVKIKKELENGADIVLGLFRVPDGSKYDSVKVDRKGNVKGVLVKQSPPLSSWIWGIWGANVKTLKRLRREVKKQKRERLLGVGMNSLAQMDDINFKAVKIGKDYFDIGTVDAVLQAKKLKDKFDF